MIKLNLRKCIVKCESDNKHAYFPKWNEFANVVDASPLVGGHPGGQIKRTFALVEYEDGTVEEVVPHKI